MIKITFPDGKVREYPKGVTGLEIAKSISERLAQEVLAVSVNGEVWDLTREINNDATVKLYKWDDDKGKYAFWHSSAHLMAEALENLFPGIKLGIGPSIENGFYYDVDFGATTFTEDQLPMVEQKMLEFAHAKQPIVRMEVTKAEALKTYKEK